jgi:hypothetical protein
MAKDWYSYFRWTLHNRWCRECQAIITTKRSDARWCSRKCRERARRREALAARVRRSLDGDDDWAHMICLGCESPLPHERRSNVRYCSHACRQRAYRQRQKADEAPSPRFVW